MSQRPKGTKGTATYCGFAKAALQWVERGIPIFPTNARTKVPLTKHGYKDATTDAEQIQAWGKRHSKANVGIDLEAARLLVLDTDPRNGGEESLAELTEDQLLPLTWCATTPGGGFHHYF